MSYSISVLIPNYNGKYLLEQNLPYVYKALKTSDIHDYEIIISDDASLDNSEKFVQKNYPDIIWINTPANTGFAGNVNRGILACTKDLILLLNTDVQLCEGYFTAQLQHFKNPEIFGVMGRIISMNSDIIQDAAKYPQYSYANIKSTLNYLPENISPDHVTACPTFFLSGANSLIDRKKLLELQGMDEIFNPYYCEDTDLGIRAWKAGYICLYEHQAVCRHPNSATIQKIPGKKVRTISKRNKMILHSIHLNGFERVYYHCTLAIKTLMHLIIFDKIYTDAYLAFRNKKQEIQNSRSRIQHMKNGALSFKEITEKIKSMIPDTVKYF